MSINFDEDLIPLIRSGKKTVTSRLIKFEVPEEAKKPTKEFSKELKNELVSKCAWKIAEEVVITTKQGETNMRAKITNIEILHISEITDERSQKEGFSSRQEFCNIIERIYGKNVVDTNRLFWVVTFEVFFRPLKKTKEIKRIDGGLHVDLERPENMDFFDFTCLKERYKFLKQYSCFSLERQNLVLSERLYTALYQNVVQSRKCFMCCIAMSDDLPLLGDETPIDILKQMQEKPVEISSHFSSVIKQCMHLIISNIHDSPFEFAQNVHDYFSSDFSDILQFDYSTFPAIYDYFSNVEVTKKAADFVIEMLRMDESAPITESILVPFFMSAHSFFEALWDSFHQNCMKATLKLSKNICFDLLMRSLKSSVRLLSEPYLEVIRYLIKFCPELARTTIIENLLTKTFKIAFCAGKKILTSGAKWIMLDMFNDVLQNPDAVSTIFACFTSDIMLIPKHPHQPTKETNVKVPYLITNRDMKLIYDILRDSPKFATFITQLAREKAKIDKKDSHVYKFDVFLAESQKFGNSNALIGDAEPELVRAWNALLLLSNKNDQDPIDILNDLIEQGKASKIFKSNEFIIFAYQQRILTFETSLARLTYAMDTSLEYQSYDNYYQSIDKMFNMLAYWSATRIVENSNVEKGIFQVSDLIGILDDAIDVVFSNVECNEVFPFEIFNATLDQFGIIIDDNLMQMQKEFQNIVCTSRVLRRHLISKYPACLYIITRFAQNLKNACEDNLGRRLVAMVSFTRCINTICKYTNCSSLRRDFFQYGLAAVENRSLLTTYLVLQRIMDIEIKLCRNWDIDNYEMWSQFSALILEIAKEKPEFMKKVISYNFLSK